MKITTTGGPCHLEAGLPALLEGLMRDGAPRCGPYRLLELLEHGRAPLFLGLRDDLEHLVSLCGRRLDHPQRWLERMRTLELQLAEADHPSLAGLRGVGVAGDWAWVAHDLRPGPRLETLLQEGGLARDAGLEVLALVSRAIGRAHTLGVTDRAITPRRIVVPAGQPPAILAFGLDALLPDRTVGCSCPDDAFLLHAAPEIVLGYRSTWGPRADVFSLGVILFRVLTGRRPVELTTDVRDYVVKLAKHLAPRPSALDPTITPALDEVCLRALEKDPARRPPDASAFADELVAAMFSGTSLSL